MQDITKKAINLGIKYALNNVLKRHNNHMKETIYIIGMDQKVINPNILLIKNNPNVCIRGQCQTHANK